MPLADGLRFRAACNRLQSRDIGSARSDGMVYNPSLPISLVGGAQRFSIPSFPIKGAPHPEWYSAGGWTADPFGAAFLKKFASICRLGLLLVLSVSRNRGHWTQHSFALSGSADERQSLRN
jgi:hypothetical protein